MVNHIREDVYLKTSKMKSEVNVKRKYSQFDQHEETEAAFKSYHDQIYNDASSATRVFCCKKKRSGRKRRSSSSYVSIGNSDPLPVISLAGDDLTEKAMSKKEPRVRPTYITSLFSLDKIRLQEEHNVQVRIPHGPNGSKKCSIVCRSYTLNGSPLSTPSSSGSEITNSFMNLCEEAKKHLCLKKIKGSEVIKHTKFQLFHVDDEEDQKTQFHIIRQINNESSERYISSCKKKRSQNRGLYHYDFSPSVNTKSVIFLHQAEEECILNESSIIEHCPHHDDHVQAAAYSHHKHHHSNTGSTSYSKNTLFNGLSTNNSSKYQLNPPILLSSALSVYNGGDDLSASISRTDYVNKLNRDQPFGISKSSSFHQISTSSDITATVPPPGAFCLVDLEYTPIPNRDEKDIASDEYHNNISEYCNQNLNQSFQLYTVNSSSGVHGTQESNSYIDMMTSSIQLNDIHNSSSSNSISDDQRGGAPSFSSYNNHEAMLSHGCDANINTLDVPSSPPLMFQQIMLNQTWHCIQRLIRSYGKKLQTVDEDIMVNLHDRELLAPLLWGYLDRSFVTGIYEAHRYLVVIWQIQHASKYKYQVETLFRAVNLMDRCLFMSSGSSINSISRRLLWLLAVTCTCIAAKIEETQRSSIIPEMQDICSSELGGQPACFTTKHLVCMERIVLKIIGFECSVPTSASFIWHYLKPFKKDKQMKRLALFLLCLSLTDYEILQFRPSIVAASSVFLACLMLNRIPPLHLIEGWTESRDDSMRGCIKRLDFLVPSSQAMGTIPSL